MNDEEKLVLAKAEDLAKRAYNGGIWQYSKFLNIAEQGLVSTIKTCPFAFFGGYDGAERAVAVFGSEELCGYESTPPVSFLKITPASEKFADTLSHRDFLGSVMALGVKREMLGDIVINANCGYLVCLDSVADFICDNLVQVRHTTVHCERIETIPDNAVPVPKTQETVVSSLRVDAVISAAYKLSRSDSKELFSKKLVFINSRPCVNGDKILEDGDVVSVRGKGRIKLIETRRETKKGRLCVLIAIY